MLLSIIVPIYNVEPFIEECAKSLLNEEVSFKDYEVVFINDGTKDNSIKVLREVVDFDIVNNFRILEKENGGLSSARNYGIKNSNGDYLWFVDSDDWIETSYIDTIISLLKNYNPDLLYLNHSVTEEETTGKKYIIGTSFDVESGSELACQKTLHGAPHFIIKRSLLTENNWYFKEGLLHEDSLFTPVLILLANKVKCCNEPVYHYRLRDGSITHGNINPKRIYDLGYIIEELIKRGKSLPKNIRYKWGERLVEIINEMMYLARKSSDEDCKKYTSQYYKRNLDAICYLLHSGWKCQLLGLLSIVLLGNLFAAYKVLYRVRY